MAEHLNDEEQLETLKRWWRQNGVPILSAVVLVGGGWFGWQFWQDSRTENAAEASLLYANMLQQLAAYEEAGAEDGSRVAASAQTLKDLHAKSQYGRYAGLVLARLAVDDGDLDDAAGQLRWVVDSARDPGLEHLATLRLARVEAARGNDDEALSLLQASVPAPLVSLYAELEGDLHLRRGDHTAASAAYRRALDNLAPADTSARPLLELKLSQAALDDAEEDA
ncbi:MAG: tetratricopeptide repeat protein [Porticoccaceae bacterium]|nr:tetratricopeptide repeat protein [Porticoccaceae bacterium]